MARKSDFLDQVVRGLDRGIKQAIRESEKQQRLYERQCLREEKERLKKITYRRKDKHC